MRGWLLDVYASANEQEGVVVWLLGEDGQRRRLHQPFPVTFYVAGPAAALRQAWRFLRQHPLHPGLRRDARRDLFAAQPLDVLAVEVARPADQPHLFRRLAGEFPDLAYYDVDLLLPLQFAARCGAFPLAHCEFEAGPGDTLLSLQPLDSPWDIDPEPPPLRVLRIGTDVDPGHRPPSAVHLYCERSSYCLPLQPERPLLVNLRAILNRHDPDLLLSAWGDTWLLPHLIELSRKLELPLPLNRDPGQEIVFRPEQSYFSYGQIIYHGRQVYLSGRWHLDTRNASFFDDYGLQGILELARVTCLPVQTAARVSPGTGISAMQILTALRQGVLVPWHKQRAEDPKSALDMIRSDQGGMVYHPVIGLHRDVAELDFISMYPSIMVNFNISPETVKTTAGTLEKVGDLEAIADRTRPGLVPQTLAPLLEKRIAYKTRQAELPAWDPRRKRYKACSSAHKWLLVTCFGYLGYKNARFGRIEAHEAVTAYGREALLRAKEAAEDMGYRVLHMYVDGMWVYRPGASDPDNLRPLLDEIARRTGLSISLDGIYRWLAFLGSRLDARVPVANRYFGVFQDGSIKMRGIEARRHDTPLYIAEAQVELIELLGKLGWPGGRQAAFALVRRKIAALRAGRVPPEKLLVKQRLSRELSEYRSPSPAARAAAQLEGREMRPGQSIYFIFTRGEPGVHAWGSAEPLNPDSVDIPHYVELLLRAAVTVFEPFGLGEEEIRARLTGGGVAQPLPLSYGKKGGRKGVAAGALRQKLARRTGAGTAPDPMPEAGAEAGEAARAKPRAR